MSLRFPFVRPLLPPPEDWIPFITATYEQRMFANGGPAVAELEGEITTRFAPSGREAVLVSSATSGLVASLLALDLRGPVLVPAFTFPASAHAIQLAGCTPVLCDVDPETWELDPEDVAATIRASDPVAILHVRPFGLCRELAPIEQLAEDARMPLIVDSASGFAGRHQSGSPVGDAGRAEVFSLHATKVLGVGEGGVVIADPELAERIRSVINFSLDGEEVLGRGLNGKLGEFPAAVGLAMLAMLDQALTDRAAAVARLGGAALASAVATMPADPGLPPWQCLPLRASSATLRDALLADFRKAGIDARTYYSPGLHRTRAFSRFAPVGAKVTDELVSRILCVPVYSDFTEAELSLFEQVLR